MLVLPREGGGYGTWRPGDLLGSSLCLAVAELPDVIAECVQRILCRFGQGRHRQRKIRLVCQLFLTAIALQIRHNALVPDRTESILRLESAPQALQR